MYFVDIVRSKMECFMDQLIEIFCEQPLECREPELQLHEKSNKIVWSKCEEDSLYEAVMVKNMKLWTEIAVYIAEKTHSAVRKPQSVSQHWRRVINPLLIKSDYTPQDIIELKRLHRLYGNQYAVIGKHMQRTDASIRYKIQQMQLRQ